MPGIVTSALTRGLATVVLVAGIATGVRAEVEITGLSESVLGNVLTALTLDEAPCALEPRLVRQQAREAEASIRTTLEVYGYYRPDIATDISFGESCWLARFAVEPGPQTMLRDVDIELSGPGAEDPPFPAAVADAGIASGEPLDQSRYESLKQRLLDIARTRGYAEAAFTSNRIDVYPAELAADISLHFETGPRYRFGDVELEQDALEDSFVDAYVDIEPGEPFDNRRLTDTYSALTDTGYFETVDVRTLPPDAATQTIAIRIVLTVSPRRLISYGVGFSTDTGPRVRFGRMIRRWNRRGHQFNLNAQLAPIVSEFTAEYRLPYGDPRYEWMSIDGGVKREETDTATSKSLEFGVRRVLERTGGWTRTQTLNYIIEDFEVGGEPGRARLFMPGLDWTRYRGDSALRPTNGSRTSFELRGGSDSLGSETNVGQVIASTKWIHSLANDGRILLRGTLGVTGVDDFSVLPPSMRFFAGGDNSIRGYKFESLGPENANGEVIGGSRLAVASFEYERPVKSMWSVAFFVDAGNAFSGVDFEAKKSAGVGARWLSPLGPIRIDIGVPINDPEHGPRLHVSLGPDL